MYVAQSVDGYWHMHVATGDLPLVINQLTSLPAGPHSVVISASDPFGYDVQQAVDYVLAEAEKTNC